MAATKKFLQITRQVFQIYWTIAPGLLTGILVTQIILTAQGIVSAYIFASLIDQVIGFVSRGVVTTVEIVPIILALSALNLVVLVVQGMNDLFNGLLQSQDIPKLKLKQTDYMMKLGMAQMENPELTNKVTRYAEVYTTIGQHLIVSIGLVSILISTIISGTIVLSFQPILVVLFVVLFAVKYVNNTRFRNKIWRLNRDNTEWRRGAWTSSTYIGEPTFLKEMMVSGGSEFIRKKFTDFTDWYYHTFRGIRVRWSAYEITQGVIDGILYAIGLYLIINKGIEGAITVGAITFYIRTLGTFSSQIDMLSYRIGRVSESSIRIQDALELFELYKPETDGDVVLEESTTPPLIELRNITFKYPSGKNPVLENLSVTIRPGEKIAIVGENGAGKTTLVKIITRIYTPQDGEVLIDEIPLKTIQVKSWYKKLGVLFQDYNTYPHLTVAENVGMGRVKKGQIDRKKVTESLKKADAMEFVSKYPKKLDQVLSERYTGGIRPSGGQWQKIAIARFFYRDAPVLLLDEPTASIDAMAEANIFNNIYKFMKGKTVIIISHRFSTVRNADRIIVLDKGKIIEDGTHEELLAQGGKYAQSFKLQAKGYV